MADIYTAAMRDALIAAATKGVLTVESDGKRVTYQNASEMLRLAATIDAYLQGSTLNDGMGRIGTVFGGFTRA